MIASNENSLHRWLRWGLLALLTLLAAVSLLQGARNALSPGGSQDFQWSGTHLLVQHIDPWADFLAGDPAHGITKAQIPNYLPLLYVLLWPIGALSAHTADTVWAFFNVVAAVAGGLLCGRFFGLRWWWCVVLADLFAMSTPVRNTVGNGQQSLLVLLVWVLALRLGATERAAAGLGLSYFKYSYAPPLFFLSLFRIGWRAALLSIVPAVAALGLVFLWLSGRLSDPKALLHLAVAPLEVARTGFFAKPDPNLMDILDWALPSARIAPGLAKAIVYALPILLAAVALYWIARLAKTLSWEHQVALMAVVSLALFKHRIYDGVVLLLPAAYCLRRLEDRRAWAVLALLSYSWYGTRVLHASQGFRTWGFLLEFALLVVAGVLLSEIRSARTGTRTLEQEQWLRRAA